MDFVTGIFSTTSAINSREQRRQAALKAASEADPVRAERPQAPIQYERNVVEIGPESDYIDNFGENQQATDSVYPTESSSPTKDYSAFAPQSNISASNQTLESMAMLSATGSEFISAQPSSSVLTCRSCGYPIKPEDRYCDNCGEDLSKNP
ncbi:MAG TPA: zinc ribbon domain-containing protein [Candidatus Poseidoniales archaeon]|nr:MAG TPA: zinc ribbon domain-containing protein [Candidatus Poseidoniales archaeon]